MPDLQFSMPTIFGLFAGGHDLIDLRLSDAGQPSAQSLTKKVHVHFDEHGNVTRTETER